MATKSKPSETAGKVKFRVIEFELEGSDASLQESLRSLATALNRGNGIPVSRQLKAPGIRSLTDDAELGSQEAPETEEIIESEDAEPAVPRPASPKRQAKVVTYDILTDVVFDDVHPTFKEFALEKAPPKDLTKYLVVAYWFKHYKKQPDVTPAHFYTAYRLMGWKVPRDPAQPMRELRSSRDNRLSKGAEPGSSVINQIGENAVDQLGKAA